MTALATSAYASIVLMAKVLYGRYLIIGVGGFGCKQATRIVRQLHWYLVHSEIALLGLIELDEQQLRQVLGAVPPRMSRAYPSSKVPGKRLVPEGFGRRSPAEVLALLPYWQPAVDVTLDAIFHALRDSEVWPSLAIIPWSPGGHGIVASYVAYRVAHEYPLASRLGMTIAPHDKDSQEEFLDVVASMDPSVRSQGNRELTYPWRDDPAATPLFPHQLITSNAGNRTDHDRVSSEMIAAIISKVRAEQAGSESLTNVLSLLRKKDLKPQEVSYLTYDYAMEPVNVKRAGEPSILTRVSKRADKRPVFTSTTTLIEQVDKAMTTLNEGRGTSALDAPRANGALVLSLPSMDRTWTQMREVESTIATRMVQRGHAQSHVFGPYWGRRDPNPTKPEDEALAARLGRIAGGFPTLEMAIRQTPVHHESVHEEEPTKPANNGMVQEPEEVL